MEIIQGSFFGVYKCIAITLAQSKKTNRDGVKSNFIVKLIRNTKGGKPRRDIIFEEDDPEVFAILNKYKNTTADAKGGYAVPLSNLASIPQEEKEILKPFMEMPGGVVLPYKLNGARYGNDTDGKRSTDAQGNPIIRSEITIFCQIDYAYPGKDGEMMFVYLDGYGPSQIGPRTEARFYREPVVQAGGTTQTDADADTVDTTTPPF